MRPKGTAGTSTTNLARTPTRTPPDHIRAVGYVRVSTDIQSAEGVSLDAQKEKLRAYCKLHGIELIGIRADEGISAKSLERPALQSALALLEKGTANTLLVVKLDRLTRSLLDLGELLSRYFAGERYHLMSVSESLDTRTAMGRFVLYILGLIAQWEREAIGERTRESMSHLKSLGVYLGAAPFGFRYSREVDADGRKRLVEIPEQQAVLLRILAMFDARDSTPTIAEKLNHENIPAPKGGTWDRSVVRRILERHQRPVKRKPQKAHRGPRVWDKGRATTLALALRADGLSLRAIGERLDEAGLSPPRGGKWHAATVMEILGAMSAPAAVTLPKRVQQLREAGLSLRAIGRQLLAEGYRPERSSKWHAASVLSLLAAS